MKRSLTVAALVLTIFVLGIVTGLLLPRPWFLSSNNLLEKQPPFGMERNEGRTGRFDGMPPRQAEGRIMNALIQRLDLKEDQKVAFKSILEKQRGEIRKSMNLVRESTKMKIDSINVVIDQEMAEVLNQKQLTMWKRFKNQMERRGPRQN